MPDARDLLGLTKADDSNAVVKSPTYDATKLAGYGTAIVAVLTPILTWVTSQPAEVKQAALVLALVSVPSFAFVLATDLASRSYVAVHQPPAAPGEAADAEKDKTKGADGSGAAVSFAGQSLAVKVKGRGDTPFRLMAARYEPAEKKWEYLIGSKTAFEWVAADDVDQYIP